MGDVWPLIGVGLSCVIMKHYSNTWGFYCNSFARDILAFFPFSLDCCLSALPKGECHLFCNDNLFCNPMSGCITICPFMFISAIWWNRGSNFAKPSLSIHVFLWLYSWGNLFCLYYKGFHYNFSSSCNPNLPVLSPTNHSCSGLCS